MTHRDRHKLAGGIFYNDIIFVFYLYTGEAKNPGGAQADCISNGNLVVKARRVPEESVLKSPRSWF